MPVFLSDEWIAALDEAAGADDKLRAATAGVSLVLQQTVTDLPDGDVTWHVAIDDGMIRILPGTSALPADVTFSQSFETAKAVATSQLSAQSAFMLGKLRIGGAVAKLIEQRAAFDGLDDLFIEVRSHTTY